MKQEEIDYASPSSFENFGQYILWHRLRLGLSQEALAEAIGASARSLRRWEHDLVLPQKMWRERLAQKFGLASQVFLGMPTSETRLSISNISSLWTVPYARNPYFTGCEKILECLRATLQATPSPQALCGMGGIGKTQIAIEYVYRFGEDYQTILWANAETSSRLGTEIRTLASTLNLPVQKEQDLHQVMRAMKRWLEQHTNWLLVIDNAEDFHLLEPLLPTRSTGHIILTTRQQSPDKITHPLAVSKWDGEASTLFLLRRTRHIELHTELAEAVPEDVCLAREIAGLLDGLPLALDQAGAYIDDSACGLAAYLERYRSFQTRLLDMRQLRKGTEAAHPASVQATLALSLAQVEDSCPEAANLLRLCAFLDADAIPEELLDWEETILQAPAHDLIKRDIAIAELRRFSLLQRDLQENTLSLHRLVQLVIQDRLLEGERKTWAERAVRLIESLFPNFDTNKVEDLPQCQRYLAHALKCAVHIRALDIKTQEAVRLLYKLGTYLFEQDEQYHVAEEALQQASAIQKALADKEDLKVAEISIVLAELFRKQNKFAEAEALYWQVYQIRSTELGEQDLQTAEALNDLAALYARTDQEQAEQLYQRTLAILEQTAGKESYYFLMTSTNLGVLYHRRHKDTQAEDLLRQVLESWEPTLSSDHPDFAFPLTSLAYLLIKQQRFDEARPLLQRALAILERFLGSTHLKRGFVLVGLGDVYQAQGALALAEQCFLEALALREQAFGSDSRHPDMLETLQRLEKLYTMQGLPAQAEGIAQRLANLSDK